VSENVISFAEMAKFRQAQEELAAKTAELEQLKKEYNEYRTQTAMIISVGEIWKLQLNDLIKSLETLHNNVGNLLSNAITLRNKLPNFDLPQR
jgi:chromosome segregation ATPase